MDVYILNVHFHEVKWLKHDHHDQHSCRKLRPQKRQSLIEPRLISAFSTPTLRLLRGPSWPSGWRHRCLEASRLDASSRMAPTWHQHGHTSTRFRSKADPKSTRDIPKFNHKSTNSRPNIDQYSTKHRPTYLPTFAQNVYQTSTANRS